MLIWRYYRFDGMNHFRGTLETSLLSLLSHIEGVNAIQKPLFSKMKEIFYVKGAIQQTTELKLLISKRHITI